MDGRPRMGVLGAEHSPAGLGKSPPPLLPPPSSVPLTIPHQQVFNMKFRRIFSKKGYGGESGTFVDLSVALFHSSRLSLPRSQRPASTIAPTANTQSRRFYVLFRRSKESKGDECRCYFPSMCFANGSVYSLAPAITTGKNRFGRAARSVVPNLETAEKPFEFAEAAGISIPVHQSGVALVLKTLHLRLDHCTY